ncbi:MAG: glycosyltransferase [Acidobacteriota bacterium]|nr:glycosyltransferase [Acidobacteriota bacterium]
MGIRPSQVRFLGRVTAAELPQYFALCDVFVTPSRPEPPSVEGFGLVFLEANACGKPVIGTRDRQATRVGRTPPCRTGAAPGLEHPHRFSATG